MYIYIYIHCIYIYINPPCGIKPADTSARYVQNHTESNKCLVYFFYNAQIPVGLHTSHELCHLMPSSKGAGEKRSKSHRHSYVSWAFVGQRRRRKPYQMLDCYPCQFSGKNVDGVEVRKASLCTAEPTSLTTPHATGPIVGNT